MSLMRSHIPLMYGATRSDPVVSRFHQNHSFSPNFPRQFFFQLDRVVDIGKLYISLGGFRIVLSCLLRHSVGAEGDHFEKGLDPVVSQYCRST